MYAQLTGPPLPRYALERIRGEREERARQALRRLDAEIRAASLGRGIPCPGCGFGGYINRCAACDWPAGVPPVNNGAVVSTAAPLRELRQAVDRCVRCSRALHRLADGSPRLCGCRTSEQRIEHSRHAGPILGVR